MILYLVTNYRHEANKTKQSQWNLFESKISNFKMLYFKICFKIWGDVRRMGYYPRANQFDCVEMLSNENYKRETTRFVAKHAGIHCLILCMGCKGRAPTWYDKMPWYIPYICRADSRFAPSQWETALLCNDVSHWLSGSLVYALYHLVQPPAFNHCMTEWTLFWHRHTMTSLENKSNSLSWSWITIV